MGGIWFLYANLQSGYPDNIFRFLAIEDGIVNFSFSLLGIQKLFYLLADVRGCNPNFQYMQKRDLNIMVFGRDIAWLDAGTHDSFLKIANFVEAIQKQLGSSCHALKRSLTTRVLSSGIGKGILLRACLQQNMDAISGILQKDMNDTIVKGLHQMIKYMNQKKFTDYMAWKN